MDTDTVVNEEIIQSPCGGVMDGSEVAEEPSLDDLDDADLDDEEGDEDDLVVEYPC